MDDEAEVTTAERECCVHCTDRHGCIVDRLHAFPCPMCPTPAEPPAADVEALAKVICEGDHPHIRANWIASELHPDHCPSCGRAAAYVLASDWLAALLADVRRDAERGIRFRVEAACDGYAALTDADVPTDVLDVDDYPRGAADAAQAIRGVLEGRA